MALKICFLVTDAISFNVLFKGQLEYFKKSNKLDITLVCGGSDDEINILKSRNVGKVVNIPLVRKPNVLKDLSALARLSYFFLYNRFDIVVYLTPKALLLGSASTSLTLQKRRVAFVLGRAYENFSGSKKLFYQMLDRFSFCVSHEVLFISKSLIDVCRSEGLIDDKANMVNKGSFSGINTDIFKPVPSHSDKSSLRESYDLPLDAFLVCIVGRICEDKGIEDILYLAENLTNQNIKFLFVGRFEDNIGRDVVEKIISNEQGFYIPHTPKIHEIFQCSDLHLFLSYREGFGNVAIEAASCGIPTYAYNVVGVKDSVANDISGQKFEFKDVHAILKAITKAATDIEFNQQYSSARKWAAENFEEEKIWQSYLDLYLNNGM